MIDCINGFKFFVVTIFQLKLASGSDCWSLHYKSILVDHCMGVLTYDSVVSLCSCHNWLDCNSIVEGNHILFLQLGAQAQSSWQGILHKPLHSDNTMAKTDQVLCVVCVCICLSVCLCVTLCFYHCLIDLGTRASSLTSTQCLSQLRHQSYLMTPSNSVPHQERSLITSSIVSGHQVRRDSRPLQSLLPIHLQVHPPQATPLLPLPLLLLLLFVFLGTSRKHTVIHTHTHTHTHTRIWEWGYCIFPFQWVTSEISGCSPTANVLEQKHTPSWTTASWWLWWVNSAC